jgi:hypothetical protein
MSIFEHFLTIGKETRKMLFRTKIDFEKECVHRAHDILKEFKLAGMSVDIGRGKVTLYLRSDEYIWDLLPYKKNLYEFERNFRLICSVAKDYLKEKPHLLKKLRPSIYERKAVYQQLIKSAFASHSEKINAILCVMKEELKIDPTHRFFRYPNLEVTKSLTDLSLSLRSFIDHAEKRMEQKIIDQYIDSQKF